MSAALTVGESIEYVSDPAPLDVTVTPEFAVVLAIVAFIAEVMAVLPVQSVSAVELESPYARIIKFLPPQPTPVEVSVVALFIPPIVMVFKRNAPAPEEFTNSVAGVTVIALSQATAWVRPWPNVIGVDPIVTLAASVDPRVAMPATIAIPNIRPNGFFFREDLTPPSKLKISIRFPPLLTLLSTHLKRP